jgi:hypothetical protein
VRADGAGTGSAGADGAADEDEDDDDGADATGAGGGATEGAAAGAGAGAGSEPLVPVVDGIPAGSSNGRTGGDIGATVGAGGGSTRRPPESGRDGGSDPLRASLAMVLGFSVSRTVLPRATAADGFGPAACDTGDVGSGATTSALGVDTGLGDGEASAVRPSAGVVGATVPSGCFGSVAVGDSGAGDVDCGTGSGVDDCDVGICADCGSTRAEDSSRENWKRCCTGWPFKNRAAP